MDFFDLFYLDKIFNFLLTNWKIELLYILKKKEYSHDVKKIVYKYWIPCIPIICYKNTFTLQER